MNKTTSISSVMFTIEVEGINEFIYFSVEKEGDFPLREILTQYVNRTYSTDGKATITLSHPFLYIANQIVNDLELDFCSIVNHNGDGVKVYKPHTCAAKKALKQVNQQY
jgi:hypothetical protein